MFYYKLLKLKFQCFLKSIDLLINITCCSSSSIRTPEPKFICNFNLPSTISKSIKSETPVIAVFGKGPLYKRVPTGL